MHTILKSRWVEDKGLQEDLGVDRRISTEWILKTQVMKMRNVFICARISKFQ
jgi:hypothetical protein